MRPADAATVALVVAGTVFFLAGTAGLLRFPGPHARLHALTKADNLGLGLVVAGLAVQASNPLTAAKLVLTWALALLAAATGANLLASASGREPGPDQRP